ncbi:MFS transporter [Pseudomonas jessenii]|jgi:AAHS family benzoate transporter-like MFS transporter|uniref:MFS transporter n=1 Tax=Pseudomonas jessenii TaxID=77298 RepID=UPI0030C3F5C7
MRPVNVYTLASESKFNSFHRLILFWCLLILVIDGYDLAVVGAALPAIMKDMGIDPTSAGVMASSAMLGTMLGAIFLGTLADRIGRPKMIAICVALFSLFTAAAGFTTDPVSFTITRFIAGLGIGGVLPIVTAQMSDFAPAKLRARLVTLVFAGYSVGGILVALTGKQLIESHGWQSVFFLAGLPALLIPFILKTMPESLAFMLKQDRQEELRVIVKKVNPAFALLEQTVLVGNPIETGSPSSPIKGLFTEGRSFSTVMIWVAFMSGLFMVYALNSWLTKLMGMAGHSLGSALNFVIVFNIGAIVGGLLGGWLSDKYNIKRVLVSFYLTGAVTLTVMGFTQHTVLLFVIVFIVGASTLGTQLIAYAYAGSFYPSAIRSTGVGFASGVGRIGAIVAPVLIGFLVSLALPLEQNFMVIGSAGLVGAAAVTLINQARADSTKSIRAPMLSS